MKRFVLSAVIAGCTLVSAQLLAQDIKSSNVPAVVKSALMGKYPSAVKVSWEKEKGNYEANWGGKSGEDMSVRFTPSGNFVKQVQAIPVNSLLPMVKEYVAAHYRGVKISEAGKVTDATGATMYEAEVHGKNLVFTESGKFLKID